MPPRVAVIGSGISGAACAATLRVGGVTVDVLERGRAPGGRMSSPTVHERRVDLGAAYFTAADDDFTDLVGHWTHRGLARAWTDTLDVYGADGHRTTTGSMRFAAPDGLRSLVRDLDPDPATGRLVSDLTELDHDAVVLAMPDPQAARLAPDAADWVGYEPVIAVAAGWAERCWPIATAAFVNDDPDLALVADDGSRRGDGAPVLVLHTTGERARAHHEDPDGAVAPLLAALRRVVGVDVAPLWTRAHRWSFAKPADTHGDERYGLVRNKGRLLGLCGDSWCPSGAPRVEAAWLSGDRLGTVLAAQLR